MTEYTVRISTHAHRQIKALPRSLQESILQALRALRSDPRPPGAKELTGMEHVYRVREADYRIVYAIRDDVLVVMVLSAMHRSQVYSAAEMDTVRQNAEAFQRHEF